jgi:hypothetical protein
MNLFRTTGTAKNASPIFSKKHLYRLLKSDVPGLFLVKVKRHASLKLLLGSDQD